VGFQRTSATTSAMMATMSEAPPAIAAINAMR